MYSLRELQVKGVLFLNTASTMFSQLWWNQSLHLLHWAIFLQSCCFLHKQYTLTFSSLTISSDPVDQ